ncbi:type 4 pilus major pilin [Endozoicomonas sp. ALC066]|uniref:type 4 pilus major pilin n=1 Tax=Endozoicomonas sp. ALC066 TaxID=3403078 RepID=UPI003BB49555
MKSRKNQKGYVSTEVGIAVFIIGVLALAGFLSSQFLVNDANSSVTVGQTIDTVKNIRNKYRYQGDFTNLSTAEVINLNAAPKTMISGTTLLNSYGGTADYTPTTCTNANDCIQLVQTRLPSDACMNYVNGIVEISDTIDVEGNPVKESGIYTIDQSTLSTACAAAANEVTSVHTKI